MALLAAAAAVLAVVEYGPSFNNSFHRDDFVYLHLAHNENFLSAVFQPTGMLLYYRPGAIALFFLERLLFGFSGGHYFVFNFLIHCANTALLMLLLSAFGLSGPTTALGAGLYLIGFGNYGKEVTAFACNSALLFAVTLSLLALLAGVRCLGIGSPGAETRRGKTRYALIAGVFLLVALSIHEVSVVTALLLLVMAYLYKGPRAVRSPSILLPAALPILLWAAVVIVVSMRYHTHQTLVFDLSVPDRWLRYTGFMLFPLQRPISSGDLNVAWLGPLFAAARPVQYVLSLGLLIVSIRLFAAGGRSIRFLVMWFYAAVFPFAFVVMEGSWLELRYIYFASAPLCGLVALGVTHVYRRRGTLAKSGTTALVIVACIATLLLIRVLERKYDRLSKSPRNIETLEEMRRSAAMRRR